MCHCGSTHSRAWHLLKWLLILLAVVAAFLAGACAGRRAVLRGGPGFVRMHDRSTMAWNREEPMLAQVFGIITAIDGPVITVRDNGDREQTVVSQSKTVIVSDGQEIGLGSLETGQAIRAGGTLDDEGKLQAKIIRRSGL